MNWIRKIFHSHDWRYYWDMSLFESKYNDGHYYYKCQKCGEDRTSNQLPEMFYITQGKEIAPKDKE